MQKARRHTFSDAPTACRHMVSGSVSLLCSRSFSPFPHGTGPLSVSGKYLALADGPAGFAQDFPCPALLRIPAGCSRRFVYGIVTLCDPPFRVGSTSTIAAYAAGPSTPTLPKQHRFGLLPFRSPLLGESLLCFLFLRVLRCFSSPRSPPPSMADGMIFSYRVAPFGYLRIHSYLPIPAAFRSLSRPSSPSGA